MKKIFKRIALWYYSEDTFNVSYVRVRGFLEKEIREGEIITVYYGGAFNPIETWNFKYLGIYKNKKVFQELNNF